MADGVLWLDGTASLRWRGPRPSTVHWDRLDDAIAVHGHGGATHVVWADTTSAIPDTTPPGSALTSAETVRPTPDTGPADTGRTTPDHPLRRPYADALRVAAHPCDGDCGLDERSCYDAHPITWSGTAGGHTHIDGAIERSWTPCSPSTTPAVTCISPPAVCTVITTTARTTPDSAARRHRPSASSARRPVSAPATGAPASRPGRRCRSWRWYHYRPVHCSWPATHAVSSKWHCNETTGAAWYVSKRWRPTG
ncbi:hypothetical protein CK936_12525 [Streptomyces albireticuli]|uniref:Uncharacterized protein n=1 Tax=Streptomyces albireticuli TaxID=1940 RepID=A0A2A2DB15_9ACTN|nr:hypothetical protein CK936_12525 [Streptomyces albireticuli]